MGKQNSYKILDCIQLKHTKIELRSDDIIQFFYGDHIHFTLDEAQELEDAVKQITKGTTYKSLRIAGEYSSLDIGVMKYLSRGKGSLYTLADAFIIHSLPQRILANFYIKVQQPYVPTAFFSKVSEAEAWLHSLDAQKLSDIHQLNLKRVF